MTRLFAHHTGKLLLLLAVALFSMQCATEASGTDTFNDVTLNTTSANADQCACLMTYAIEDISSAEIDALQFMREEEKLARDVYLRLQEKWNAKVFANIASSEQKHMDAMKCLLDKYNLEDPVGDNAKGEFVNANLAVLYTQLVEQGLVSLEAAYKVGATIEDLDINDLQQAEVTIDNADIVAAFAELERGSRNHLRAFTRQLATLNASYTPSYLTVEAYEAIINTDNERSSALCGSCTGNQQGNQGAANCAGNSSGNGNCSGNGSGNGPGNGNGPGGNHNCSGQGG